MPRTWLRGIAEHGHAHPRRRDAFAALGYLLLGLALLQFGGYRIWEQTAIWQHDFAFLLLLVGMAALATQRSAHPFAVLGIGACLTAIDLTLGSSLGVVLLFADFVYCAFRYGTDRGVRILLATILAVGVATVISMPFWSPEHPQAAGVAVQWALLVLVASMWGWSVRSERQLTRASLGAQHAAQTRRLRERIAHELHDHVSNEIAVAGLHIEAARLRLSGDAPDAPEIERCLDRATAGTVQAHQQLRRLITMLTTVDDLDVAQIPAMDDLASLVPAGRSLRLDDDLEAATAAHGPHAAAVIRRALRELVTNAVKHGDGDIVVEASPARVVVRNRIRSAGTAAAGTGIGIAGAALLLNTIGAELHSEPAADADEWRATITVPALGPASSSGTAPMPDAASMPGTVPMPKEEADG